MSDREPLCRVSATDAAIEALDGLRAVHGEIMLHLPGGAEDAGTPTCLPVGELQIATGTVIRCARQDSNVQRT